MTTYQVWVNARLDGKEETTRERAERRAVKLSQTKRHVQLVKAPGGKSYPEVLRSWTNGKEDKR